MDVGDEKFVEDEVLDVGGLGGARVADASDGCAAKPLQDLQDGVGDGDFYFCHAAAAVG